MVVATSPTIGYEETYADLSFRLIASPVLALGVPGPIAPAQITWSLRASPNPFASSIALAWEGSSGPVSIEVLDVRGRIIRSVRPQLAGLAGTWMWRGETAAGRRAPPGVYFVRASRGGQSAVRRVTLLP